MNNLLFRNVDKNKTTKSSVGIPLQLGSSIVLGIAFGFLMNKSHVYLAPIIRDQMLFKRLTMFKMFLAAVGMSMLSVFLILIINESIYRRTLNGFIQKVNRIDGKFFKTKSEFQSIFFFFIAIRLAVGGSLIGVGMVLAGSCPGTIFVQM
jgi:uncharacterized membrane protein YedE/YeeE